MEPTLSLTLEQVDGINRSLNHTMALSRVLANCSTGERPGSEPPEPLDIFLVMQVMLEELEKIRAITRGLGKKSPE